jgi:acyl-CoA synthetase (AMP-forming)/AMP-acid ligase II
MRLMPTVLRDRAQAEPDARAYTFLDDGEREGAQMTWGDLDSRASSLACAISAYAPPGARALILCPPGLSFIPAFFGALRAGAIAVSAYPPRAARPDVDAGINSVPGGFAPPDPPTRSLAGTPRSPRRSRASLAALVPQDRSLAPQDRSLARLRAIASDAAPAVVLATPALAQRAAAIAALVPELAAATWIDIDAEGASPRPFKDTTIESHAVAFLQYTSGSTAEPRGVMVSHANLFHNLADSQALARHDRTSASVSWLPVIHDMGLIQGVLQPAFSGFPAWLMSPAAFLQRPARWLRAISSTGATISGGPNFSYELCVRRISAVEREGLDLRRWRHAFNGAEPIRQSTLDAFHAMFAPCGFDAGAFRPCYGLAEATLLVSTGFGASTACGHAAAGTDIRIVDPHTLRPAGHATPGEIWVAGPGVAAGYWNQPDATASTFDARIAGCDDGPFLRTGDLGVLRADGLHVTGRIKDILIVRGVKHFPQDIEETIERATPSVRAGCCAVFSMPDADGDKVGVAAELDSDGPVPRPADTGDAVILNIREAVGAAHGIQVSAVALVAPGAIPKTTSGKLQRFACREGLLSGRLTPLCLWAAVGVAGLAEAS